jgi:hypothetical protein
MQSRFIKYNVTLTDDSLNRCGRSFKQYFAKMGVHRQIYTSSPSSVLCWTRKSNIYCEYTKNARPKRIVFDSTEYAGVIGHFAENWFEHFWLRVFEESCCHIDSVLECWKIYSNYAVCKNTIGLYLMNIRRLSRTAKPFYLDNCLSVVEQELSGVSNYITANIMTLPWFDRLNRMIFWKMLILTNSLCNFNPLILFVNQYL